MSDWVEGWAEAGSMGVDRPDVRWRWATGSAKLETLIAASA
ncbi:hypothetical protein [Limnothrix redekei]|uniref:Uncharacterized protein n=1 Tax=Limnothrix redekei LRLZ20PSL1 TaxID=3112953 RepID=A0ABW7CB21_9CYAN